MEEVSYRQMNFESRRVSAESCDGRLYPEPPAKAFKSLWEKMEEMNGHEMDKIHALLRARTNGWKQSSGSWNLGI